MGAFISLLLAVDATWPAVSSSCHSDFPAMMDCNLEFWAKSQLFLPYIAIFFKIFHHNTVSETTKSSFPSTMRLLSASFSYSVSLVISSCLFSQWELPWFSLSMALLFMVLVFLNPAVIQTYCVIVFPKRFFFYIYITSSSYFMITLYLLMYVNVTSSFLLFGLRVFCTILLTSIFPFLSVVLYLLCSIELSFLERVR